MSRVFKAPNVQLNQEKFYVKSTPPQFNRNLGGNVNNFGNNNFEEIDDKIDFGTPDFEKSQQKLDANIQTEINQANQEADDIIAKANEEAERIMEEAKIEAEQLKAELIEQSKEEGFIKGHAEGIEKANEEMQVQIDAKMDELEEERESIQKEADEAFLNIEKQAVDVISHVLEKLLNNAFDVESSLIVQLVKIGLQQTTLSDEVNVKVSEGIVDYINENIDDLYKSVDSNVKLNIITDMTLENNECIIETELGYVKCDLDSVIESLKFNLKSLLNN